METLKASKITDLRQSASYAKYIRSIGWRVERVDSINIFIRPLGIFGAIAKIQRVNLPLPWNKIRPVLKKHRVWMTKFEPVATGKIPPGFRQDSWPLLASKTLRIDLNNVKPKKDARYCIRKARSTNYKIRKNDFGEFYQLWKKAAKIKKLWIPPKKHFDSLVESFGQNCLCLTINNLAGALILIHNQVAYYYYAASLPESKKAYLPYFVVWELIKEAKKRGCKIWDWEGIFDSRWPNKGWRGFTHFKKSFGGYEVSFPGSFTRWF